MSPRQIQLVQATFHSLRPIGDQAAALFYVRLFEFAPWLRPLCHGEMNRQRRQLIELLGQVVLRLDENDPGLARALDDATCAGLARLDARDYAAMETTLLWTLRQVLGPAFSPPVEEAWATFYRRLAGEVRRTGSGGQAA